MNDVSLLSLHWNERNPALQSKSNKQVSCMTFDWLKSAERRNKWSENVVRVMCRGRDTVSKPLWLCVHCKISTMYAVMDGTTVIVCHRLAHIGPQLRDKGKTAPRQVCTASSRRVGLKTTTIHFITTCHSFCSPYTHPWGTNQTADRLHRQYLSEFQRRFKSRCRNASINKRALRSKTFKKQTYALNPGELMLGFGLIS